MRVFKGLTIKSQKQMDKELRAAERRSAKVAESSSKARIEELEKALARKEKQLDVVKSDYANDVESFDREIKNLTAKVEVYEEERDEARDVVKQQIANDDQEALLSAKKEGLDKREAKMKDRESRLESEEEGRYKAGYSDGLSDGLRKAHEITAEDRNNAMKIAMVSAASHTPTETMKEINSEYRLTSGTENK